MIKSLGLYRANKALGRTHACTEVILMSLLLHCNGFAYVLNKSLNETYGQNTDTWICIDLLLSIKYILFYSILFIGSHALAVCVDLPRSDTSSQFIHGHS